MAAWAGLGYYARARNLLACARAVAAARRRFPDTEEGCARSRRRAYTAAAVAAIAFDRPAAVVDGNVERVMARLFAVEEPLPAAKPRLNALAAALTPASAAGDYAQAVMDLGATICTPKAPACGICPLAAPAPPAGRIAAELPRRSAEAGEARAPRHRLPGAPRRRRGARRDPPAPGLLGGMLALPASDWVEAPPPPRPPFRGRLARPRRGAPHLHPLPPDPRVQGARVAGASRPHRRLSPAPGLDAALPSVMRKALRLGLAALAGEASAPGRSRR